MGDVEPGVGFAVKVGGDGARGEGREDGGIDATMDRIAEVAGVGIATMYRRFPDKADLIDALFEKRIEQVVQVAEEALTYDDAWEGLVYFMMESLTMFAANRGLADIVFEPSMQGPKTLSRSRQRLPALGERLIRRAQQEGRLRPDLETTDIPMLQLMVSLIVRFAGDVSPQLWSRYLTLILDGLRADRRRPTPLPVRGTRSR